MIVSGSIGIQVAGTHLGKAVISLDYGALDGTLT